jgi:sRNA-binding regulator protein Hfq
VARNLSVSTGGAMKDASPSVPAEKEGFANRKLIRPLLNSNHTNHAAPAMGERRARPERAPDRSNGSRGKSAPPDQTNAENFYYQKQMQSKTPMVIVLLDDEEIHGVIEWYDRTCIKVNRTSAPNVMIYKLSIKYMFKEGERK